MKAVSWAYRLEGRTSPGVTRAQAGLVRALQAGFVTEATLQRRTGQAPGPLLLRLDGTGRLARELRAGQRAWARVLPQRAPDGAPPVQQARGPLRLVDSAVLHAGADGLVLEAPGAWARLTLMQPDLLVLLHGLARGSSAAKLRRMVPGADAVLHELLLMMDWCGLLAGTRTMTWAAQDLLFHSRTRRGFGSAAVGKLAVPAAASTVDPVAHVGPRIALVKGADADLPVALGEALRSRQSLRAHGAEVLSIQVLGQLLWHALAQQPVQGRLRRPYPSGGSCYALQPYVVVAHCSGLAAGTYAYDARTHELVRSDDGSTSVLPVMRDAAASARMDADPQVLLVLCADYARMRGAYGDLGYGLLLKEVGAVMQTVQLVATAMGLASCPLGTGDSVAFARLAGVGPLVMPSVGELLLGAAVGAMEGGAEG